MKHNNFLKLHCYTGTENFGCPKYGIPEKFLKLWNHEKKNSLQKFTCPVSGSDVILVTTTRDKTDLHEKIYQLYTKNGFQVRFLIGRSKSSYDKLPLLENYIIGDFEDRYENLHFKTFSAYQFVALCFLQNSNVIFLDDDTFFNPFEKILPAPITCGHARFNPCGESDLKNGLLGLFRAVTRR